MSDNRLTFEEVTELFGGTIPMEALVILTDAPDDKPVEEVRDEITNLALKWHRRDPAAFVPPAFDPTMHPSEREIAQATITRLTAELDALREAADSLALKLQAYVDMTGNTLGTGALKRYAALNNSTPRDETAV